MKFGMIYKRKGGEVINSMVYGGNFIKFFFSFGSKLLGGFINFSFFALFVGVIFIGAAIHSFQQESFQPIVDGLGGRFFGVLNNLNQESLKLISQGGIVGEGIWNNIQNYWSFFSNLYIMYFEIWVLAKLISFSPFSDSSKHFTNWGIGILMFFTLQEFYILFYNLGNINYPFEAVKNTFKASSYLFEPIKGVAERVIDAPSDILNNSNLTTNLS